MTTSPPPTTARGASRWTASSGSCCSASGSDLNDHVFVKTRTKEFHYPKGDDNVTTTYDGEGGVAVDSFFRKLLFSVRFRSERPRLREDPHQGVPLPERG